MTDTIADSRQRDRALDTSQSFIVQAPAGSGKTTLLIQRYLKLLAISNQPEEIIAITFTRKAAAEMRNRIMEAFQLAQKDQPESAHEQQLWRIACEASKRDAEQGWQLSRNPGRLQIQTIDSLTSRLVRMMPMLSQSGGALSPTDRAKPLYREAARNALLEIDSRSSWSESVAELLIHLDNNFARVEELLAGMLAHRDQWLRLIQAGSDEQQRELLESTLERLVSDALQEISVADQQNITAELAEIAHLTAKQLHDEGRDQQGWECYIEASTAPSPLAEECSRWQALASLIFKKSAPELRKTVNVTSGFLKGQDELKARFLALLEKIREQPGLLKAFAQLRDLPAARYSQDEWHLLSALTELLTLATAQLQLVFSDRGEVDHIEIAIRALDALGHSDMPTDLALMLDYRINHLLVDEFQDTSHGQYELLKKLTGGWQADDGRTLFCVGDPMQSIYRFREADVGLYLDAAENGIGDIQLEQLTLSVNFRSHKVIVDWVNQAFPACFPAHSDSNLGAVPYSFADSFINDGIAGEVSVYPFGSDSHQEEAQQIIDIIHATPAEHKIAILIRSRSHLDAIIPALRNATIPFRVTDTEQLNTLSVVKDLRSLVRALHHPGDRIAWISLLRSPYCGILLDDLNTIAMCIPEGAMWPALSTLDQSLLSADGAQRLTRFLSIVTPAMQHRGRQALREATEALWLTLGGRDALRSRRDLLAAELFFTTLESLESAAGLDDLQQFDDALDELYAPADPDADERIQILTMHKSKGLEFDCVILPALGRRPHASDKALLQYLLTHDEFGNEELLMASIEATGDDVSPTSQYIRSINKQRDAFELQRLLYVATTRAKRSLHLLGYAKPATKKGEPKPQTGSLLDSLWPAVRQYFDELSEPAEESEQEALIIPELHRLPADWQAQLPQAIAQLPQPEVTTSITQQPEFIWAGELARHTGTVIHGMLERIANEGLDRWDEEKIQASSPLIQRWLLSLGCTPEESQKAVERVKFGLLNTIRDPQGRWILDSHDQASCEYGITIKQHDSIKHLIIDRLLTDADGTRWVIDYKSGSHHEIETLETFLECESERYREQLHGYWHALKLLDGKPSRLALYFPMLQTLREIPAPE